MEEEIKINSIGEILGSTFKDGAEYSNTAKTAIFFSFWSDIVGKKYSKNTKPYSLNIGKLYVSCKNSFVLQEISMYKKEIINKAQIYSKAVDIEISDIVFSYKNWAELNKTLDDLSDDENNPLIDFDQYKFDDKNIRMMVDKISFLSDKQKSKLIKDIKNNIIKEELNKNTL